MKVLIVSHNLISNQNNMGKTFLSLFAQFQKEELCQLYVYPTMPNEDRCSSYYRVTDKEVLASLVCKWKKPGAEVEKKRIRAEEALFEDPKDVTTYRNPKNKSAVRRLLRDAMWSASCWYSRDLKAWLEREAPDVIFVAPGAAKFLYNIALRISRDWNLPIIAYICDEYYFVRKPQSQIEQLRLQLLQKKMQELMAGTTHLAVISQELKESYEKCFGVPATVLMTGTSYRVAEQINCVDAPTEICYFGNIRCNRYRVLAQIGQELDSINRELGTAYLLKIYTAEKNPGILDTFSNIASVQLCGFLSGEEFDKVFHSAQLLLHTEAFDEASVDFTQHSVSTKIADSLARGIPLLAYGPDQISSMKHLLRNDCAIVATDKVQLRQMLMTAFTDAQARHRAAVNGLKTARQYHENGAASQTLRRILESILPE